MNKLLCFLGVGRGRGNGGKVDVTSVAKCPREAGRSGHAGVNDQTFFFFLFLVGECFLPSY